MKSGPQLRDEGLALVESNNKAWLAEMRIFAKYTCLLFGNADSDLIHMHAEILEWQPSSPNAYGAVFNLAKFVPTGERVRSKRPEAHGREIKVWRLKS